MFFKNQYKKINNILLIIFISNLVLSGLFLAPIQIQAAINVEENYPENTTTNPETGQITTNLENVVDTISDIHNTIGKGSTKTSIGLIIENIVDINYICTMLANAATALPFGAGYALATTISLTCPKILHEALSQLGFYKEKLRTGESIQTIPVPSLESYTWEVGIPGFIKPGQITEFK